MLLSYLFNHSNKHVLIFFFKFDFYNLEITYMYIKLWDSFGENDAKIEDFGVYISKVIIGSMSLPPPTRKGKVTKSSIGIGLRLQANKSNQ